LVKTLLFFFFAFFAVKSYCFFFIRADSSDSWLTLFSYFFLQARIPDGASPPEISCNKDRCVTFPTSAEAGYRLHSARNIASFIPMGSAHFFIIIFYRFDIKEMTTLLQNFYFGTK
jgi:hypothetical protein